MQMPAQRLGPRLTRVYGGLFTTPVTTGIAAAQARSQKINVWLLNNPSQGCLPQSRVPPRRTCGVKYTSLDELLLRLSGGY